MNLKDLLPNLFGQRSRKRKMRVSEALDYLVQEESRSSSTWSGSAVALERVETSASSSSTRSTRSPDAKGATARM